MATCPVCGWWERVCKCKDNSLPNVQVFKPMWYNDICETPLFITSKKQLKEECKKHEVISCRLL